MNTIRKAICWILFSATLAPAALLAQPSAPTTTPAGPRDPREPHVFVPYSELSHFLDPAAKSVLLDRAQFEQLLAAARQADRLRPTVATAVLADAQYDLAVTGSTLQLRGELTVISGDDRPLAVPLPLGQMGLTRLTLDGKPAPVGHDDKGQLLLVVQGRGRHKLALIATAALSELSGGGMQFGLRIPAAAAGLMRLAAPGDLEIKSTAPVTAAVYDRTLDRTFAELAVGGNSDLTVLLLGNGRQEQQRVVLLGESATNVQITSGGQSLSCLYMVQIFRRSVRELRFAVPAGWTVSDVVAPNMVRWAIQPGPADQPQILAVTLAGATQATQPVHIQAAIARPTGPSWTAPAVQLLDAAYQRGYVLVDTGQDFRARSHRLTHARQQDVANASGIVRLLGAPLGRVYYHWGDQWKIDLDLVHVGVRRSGDSQQLVQVGATGVALVGTFDISAVGRPMYDFAIELPPAGWTLDQVTVDGKSDGFQYSIDQSGRGRTLTVELARPTPPEGVARAVVVLRHLPEEWNRLESSRRRRLDVPLMRPRVNDDSELIAVATSDMLDAETPSRTGGVQDRLPPGWSPVPVGRMAQMGLGPDVRLAFTVDRSAPSGAGEGKLQLSLEVTRPQPRLAVESAGLIDLTPTKLIGQWLLQFNVSRSPVRTLNVLVDRSVGRDVQFSLWRGRLTGQRIVPADQAAGINRSPDRYNLWELTLEDEAAGLLLLSVRFELAASEGRRSAPLVRPVAADQTSELLAVQADEQLDVTLSAVGAARVDPDAVGSRTSLLRNANRVLGAFQLDSLADAGATTQPAESAVSIVSRLHDRYALPAAVVTRASLTTHVGPPADQVEQRTVAVLSVANAGLQFLRIRLPDSAELWSVRVGERQSRVQRDANGDHLVALPPTRAPVEVRVVYAAKSAAQGDRVSLVALTLPGVQINQSEWNVVPPSGYRVRGGDAGAMAPTSLRGDGPLAVVADAAPASKAVFSPELFSESGRSREKQEAPPSEVAAKGRLTLPVELVAANESDAATFTGLGAPQLAVRLDSRSHGWAWMLVGGAAVLLAGLSLINTSAGRKLVAFLILLAAGAALYAAGAAWLGSGALMALVPLFGLYLIVAAVRQSRRLASRGWAAVALLVLLAMLPASARAGGAVEQAPQSQTGQMDLRPARQDVVVPYADPTRLDQADKVLVPYARFVDLWNKAHPDRPLTQSEGRSEVALADARYQLDIAGQQAELTLTADVSMIGPANAAFALPLPMDNLAVVEATLDGQPARLVRDGEGDKKLSLMLAGGSRGALRVKMLTTPRWSGPKGTLDVALPPLPAAVMVVALPRDDLQLASPGTLAPPSKLDGQPGRWLVPLNLTSRLSLRWQPQSGGGEADSALSAQSRHRVDVRHFGLLGRYSLVYNFTGGDRDSFRMLKPVELTLTAVEGANLRDYRVIEQQTVDGQRFDVVEVRLYRPASRTFTLNADWVADLPPLDASARLPLPRAGEVLHEVGRLSLRAAPGMGVQVTDVSGGRRENVAPEPGLDAVGSWYWPFHPFAMTLKLSRDSGRPRVQLDQLVRIHSGRSVQLLARVTLTSSSTTAKVFDCSFAVPPGYRVISVTGADVGSDYVQTTPQGDRLHVSLRGGVAVSRLAIVLLNGDATLDPLDVPMLSAVTPQGDRLAEQSGRLAVQIAPALAATSVSSQNVTAVAPSTLSDWLQPNETALVRFAYRYPSQPPAVRLSVSPRPSRTRAEVVAAVSVQPSSAWMTYRIRYTIEGSPLDQVSFTLPTRYAPLVSLIRQQQGGVVRSVTQSDAGNGRTRWNVALLNEVTGVLDIGLDFVLPLDPNQANLLATPQLICDNVEGVRTVVAVQNLSRHELSVTQRENLLDVPAEQQNALLPPGSQGALQYVVQSFRDDWAFVLAVSPAQQATQAAAIIDLMTLTTAIDPSGQCRYEVTLSLQNRSEQFLRVALPKGLTIWSASAAGRPVRPVVDSQTPDQVLIPLTQTSSGGVPCEVKFYAGGQVVQPFGRFARISPPAIRIVNVDVVRSAWTLRLPPNYHYRTAGGNMSSVTDEGLTVVKVLTATEQLRRLERQLDETSAYDSQGKRQMAERVFEFNNRLKADLSKSDRRGDDDYETYRKLADRLDEKVARVSSQPSAEGNVNWSLTRDMPNGGTREFDRNLALNALPQFVEQIEQAQHEQLKESLAQADKPMTGTYSGIIFDKPSDELSKTGAGTLSVGGSVSGTGKLSKVLEETASRNVSQQQQALQMQLEGLKDNRLKRMVAKGNTYEGGTPTFNGDASANRHHGLNGYAGGANVDANDLNGTSQILNGGTLSLDGPNGYTGLTRVGGGTLILDGDNSSTNAVSPNGAALNLGGNNSFTDATIVNGGALVLRGDARQNQLIIGSGESRINNGQNPYASGVLTFTDGPQDTGHARDVIANWRVQRQGRFADQEGSGLTWSYDVPGNAPTGPAVDAGRPATSQPDLAEGGEIYAATGTASLPVALPEGGMRLDYTRPAGDPTIELYVVERQTADSLTGGAGFVGFLLALWVLVGLSRLARRRRKAASN